MLTQDELKKIFAEDDRIVEVAEYPQGFVANAYRWSAPGKRVVTTRGGETFHEVYDRKRSYGQGPAWVARSARRGCLFAG